MRKPYMDVAKELLEDKYKNTKCAFVTGSVVTGEATETSDIDLYVIFDYSLRQNAYRESMVYQGWPVEVFVNNTNSVDFFFKKDMERGIPATANMLSRGILIPAGDAYGESLKKKAEEILRNGPPLLSKEELEARRYEITDRIDNVRAYRNKAELYGSLSALFHQLGDFHLRANGKWSGGGKHLVRALAAMDVGLVERYEQAFEQAFSGNVTSVVALAEEIMGPHGGSFWAGYTSPSPDDANSTANVEN